MKKVSEDEDGDKRKIGRKGRLRKVPGTGKTKIRERILRTKKKSKKTLERKLMRPSYYFYL